MGWCRKPGYLRKLRKKIWGPPDEWLLSLKISRATTWKRSFQDQWAVATQGTWSLTHFLVGRAEQNRAGLP